MTKHNIEMICNRCGGTHLHEKNVSMPHTNRHLHQIRCCQCGMILKS